MTIFGPDGSHHQAGIKITDADLARTSFMLWRASIGSKTDRTFATQASLAQDRKVPFAAYHFVYQTEVYSGSGGKAHPADVQADTCITALGGRADIPVMLDWESDGSQRPRWSDVVKVATAMRNKGLTVTMVYTGKWWWEQMGRPDLSTLKCALVNANYGKNVQGNQAAVYAAGGGDNHPGWKGYGGMVPTILQFGSRVTFGDRLMDMNAYKGTRQENGPFYRISDLFCTWGDTAPQPPMDWVARGAEMSTPDAKVPITYGDIHQNVPWLQAVLCSMPQDTGPNKGDPIFNPAWVGFDTINGPSTPNLYGEATIQAFNYWLVRNDLPVVPKGGYPTPEAEAQAWATSMQKMKQVRKR